MAITNLDYQVRLKTSYGVDCLNVFWYRAGSPFAAGRAAQLAAAFNTTICNALGNALNTIAQIGAIQVENLVDLSDYHEQESTVVQGGISSTSPAPPFTAYNFQLVRSTRAGRHGYKRFVGVSEELVSFGTSTVSGALATAIPALAGALHDPITSGGVTFTHMIPKRGKVTLPDGSFTYVLTDLLPIGQVIFRGLTTQNTRKS